MPPPRLQVVRNDSEAGSPCASIDVTIESIDRLFHVLDPSPGVERDLDELVESYVLASARELPGRDFKLVFHVPSSEVPRGPLAGALARAVTTYFGSRRDEEARKLTSLMREGRQALVIGLAFLFACGALGWVALQQFSDPLGSFLDEGLLIIGWVALWRPVEMLLYDWRPIWREKKMLDKLANVPVEFRILSEGSS